MELPSKEAWGLPALGSCGGGGGLAEGWGETPPGRGSEHCEGGQPILMPVPFKTKNKGFRMILESEKLHTTVVRWGPVHCIGMYEIGCIEQKLSSLGIR